ncbi:MAG: RNA 2',3'-cyclic phosphodiesterase [Anaerolineae bacterium]
MPDDEILRTFIAIELDEPLRQALGHVQGKFKRQIAARDVRWVAIENLHLTLKFLGDTPRSRLPEVEAALRAACSAHAAFEIGFEGRGCFPNFRRPRVIWVAVRDRGQALARLQADVEKHIAPLGWPTEERGFSPHLTLGRVARGVDRDTEEAIGQIVEKTVVEQIGVQRVTAVSLMQSDLRPAGPIYTRLLHVPLQTSA